MECQRHENCGGYCETSEQEDAALCEHCIEADRQRDADDAALLAVRRAVSDYYSALDRREHGGVAQDKAFRAIEAALGMHWVQGASISGKTPN